LRYQDRADLFEIFSDSVGPWSFDGNTMRIEFMVTRLDEPKRAKRVPDGSTRCAAWH
jgi:hypothetical protein